MTAETDLLEGTGVARSTDAARKKMVWRISDSNPKGGWVDAEAVTEPHSTAGDKTAEAPNITFGGWVMSSFDLLKGLDVSDGTGPCLPNCSTSCSRRAARAPGRPLSRPPSVERRAADQARQRRAGRPVRVARTRRELGAVA